MKTLILITTLFFSGCAAIKEHHEGITFNRFPTQSKAYIERKLTIYFVAEPRKYCGEVSYIACAEIGGNTIWMRARGDMAGTYYRTLQVQFTKWAQPEMRGGVLYVYDPLPESDRCAAGELLAESWGFEMGLNDICVLGHEVIDHIAGGRDD